MPRYQLRERHRAKNYPAMSNDRNGEDEDVAFSPRHVSMTGGNARNRVRTVSGSSSNLDYNPDSALLGDNDNEDVIEGQEYTERVVIVTETDERAIDEDSGISEAAEDQLLSESRDAEHKVEPRKETIWHVGIQVFIPFLIAGFGMMGAGLLLDKVQVWMDVWSA